MRRLIHPVFACIGCITLLGGIAQAQRGVEWTTSNYDAQRTSWVKIDDWISPQSMMKPGFQLLYKLKLDNRNVQLDSLSQPVMVGRVVGYRGFKTMAIMAGAAGTVYSIDVDLARMEWQTKVQDPPAQPGTLACPAGLSSALTRPTALDPNAIGGGGGRPRGPIGSAVGAPGRGAVSLANANAPRNRGRGGDSGPPDADYIVAGDGMVHALNIQSGADDHMAPIRFLPPNAKASGLIVADGVLYAGTSDNCGNAPNGIWALDLASDAKTVATWETKGGGIAGTAGPALGLDGTVYAATGDGAYGMSSYSDSVVALAPKTLKLKSWFTPGKSEFVASPVVFQHNGKDLIVAANADGRLYLLDSASLGGADHKTPLYRTTQFSSGGFDAGAISSFEDEAGTRWVLVAFGGPVNAATKFPITNGTITNGGIAAFKLVEQSGKPTLQPGWVSPDMVSPIPPIIIHGVVFAAASGEYRPDGMQMTAAEIAQRSKPAVLHALDGTTGKSLWNSGATITSFLHRAGLVGGNYGQMYLAANDNTFYAFGFPMEH